MTVVTPKSVLVSGKKIELLIGNTSEALQCVILHQKAPKGACRPFKVLTLAHAKNLKLILLYIVVYFGT